jgi:hypothetical protein
MSSRAADRPPSSATRLRSRLAGLEAALRGIGLPAWFVAIDLLWIARPEVLGIDARHYQRAATAWLEGGNPWLVEQSGFQYAAGPHTLLLYVPTRWLPLEAAVGLWLAVGIGASVWLIRRLRLPVWWLLFPPLFHAIWNGNPQTIMVALLVQGSAVAAAASAAVKLYALVPLLWRPRQLIVAGALLGATLLVLPWELYLDTGFGIGSHLTTAWNGSAWRIPILLVPTIVALWIIRRRGGEWFAVPAVFPATQFYYVSTALPAVAGRPVLAAALAVPVPLLVPAVVILLAMREVRPGLHLGGRLHSEPAVATAPRAR